MFESFILFVLLLMVIMIVIWVIMLPIMIANARGICGTAKTIITTLSWLGILLGVTWIIALMMSLLWTNKNNPLMDNLDQLEKLAKLYKAKVISKSEYDKMKSKLLND